MQKYVLVDLFQDFINKSASKKRLKPNGHALKAGTLLNYQCTLNTLKAFEAYQHSNYHLLIHAKPTPHFILAQFNYWKRFYFHFTQYLYKTRGCYDNYVGSVIKSIRAFFKYLRKEKYPGMGAYHEAFYVPHEEVPIIVLSADRLRFLIHDSAFKTKLSSTESSAKDFLVFGCAVGLRFSDLINIRGKDILDLTGEKYLKWTSIKTETESLVLLPEFAIKIAAKYSGIRPPDKRLFPIKSLHQFNAQLRSIAFKAGWIELIPKIRHRRGLRCVLTHKTSKKELRFCDLISSHIMRRTAITTMLLAGIPEQVVRKISGHSATSGSFYRYVKYTQQFLDASLMKMHKIFE